MNGNQNILNEPKIEFLLTEEKKNQPKCDQSAMIKYPPRGKTTFIPIEFKKLIMKSRFLCNSVDLELKKQLGESKRSDSVSSAIAIASCKTINSNENAYG